MKAKEPCQFAAEEIAAQNVKSHKDPSRAFLWPSALTVHTGQREDSNQVTHERRADRVSAKDAKERERTAWKTDPGVPSCFASFADQ